ncbi:MAG: hypothetical protein ACFCU5_10600 [Pleurocapsa sp.]
MKIKYWSTLAAASILSLGLVTSCATPEGGDTNTDGMETPPGAVDPGAAPDDSYAAPDDPCAAPAEGQ